MPVGRDPISLIARRTLFSYNSYLISWRRTDLMFGFVTVNSTSMIAALSVTSKIVISSNWISRGSTSRGVSEGEIRLPPDTSSMIVEPENPTIPRIIAKAATIPPTIILEFNSFNTSVTILNVETKNAYSDLY